MQTVILAAGRGTRFGALTETKPKPLIEVGGKVLIRHVLDALPEQIDGCVIVLGHLGHLIERELGCVYRGRSLKYVWQEERGTGGALLAARALLTGQEPFMVVGADDMFDKEELEALIDPHAFASVARETCGEPWASYGVYYGLSGKGSTMSADFDSEQILTGFRTVSDPLQPRHFGVGAYVLPQAMFDQPFHRLPNGELSIPHTFAQASFPVHCVQFHHWLPVNTPEEREWAERQLIAAHPVVHP